MKETRNVWLVHKKTPPVKKDTYSINLKMNKNENKKI